MLIGRHPDGYEVDTDPARIDVDLLHSWLSTDAYWALGRSRETVQRSIRNSLNFGLCRSGAGLVGFGRAVTDYATFAYLGDVYLDRTVRGVGLGVWFVGTVTAHLRGFGCRRLLLTTADAHGVYARFGFTPLATPERWMEVFNG